MPIAALEGALRPAADDAPREHMALAASGPSLYGVILFGDVAGTEGAAEVHALAVADDPGAGAVATGLVDSAVAAMRARGARLVMCEVPADPRLAPVVDRLRSAGFREDARIPDLIRDGVDLLLLRRDL